MAAQWGHADSTIRLLFDATHSSNCYCGVFSCGASRQHGIQPRSASALLTSVHDGWRFRASLLAGSDALRGTATSNPQEHIKRIEYYIKLGFRGIQICNLGPDEEGFIKMYGKDVIPYLKETYGRL